MYEAVTLRLCATLDEVGRSDVAGRIELALGPYWQASWWETGRDLHTFAGESGEGFRSLPWAGCHHAKSIQKGVIEPCRHSGACPSLAS
jgi:hypothetical protein